MRGLTAGGVVLTGATGGLGRAFAEALAAPGRPMLLLARDAARLAALADRLAGLGAEPRIAALDLRDHAALADRLAAFDARAPVELLIANAGVSAGRRPDGSAEGGEAARRVIATNLLGTVNTVEPLLPAMRARRRGRILLVSSLAALRPLPAMPAYGASKAGIRAYGTALRGALAGSGVGVTVACPGFVDTPMSRRHRGPRPFEVPPERAVRRMLAAAARGRALVSFPWPLVALAWLGARLPPGLSDRAVRRFDAVIEPEADGPA